MPAIVTKKIDPKKQVKTVPRTASANSDQARAQGDADRVEAARTGNDYNVAGGAGRHAGSHMGDKSVKIARVNPVRGGTARLLRKSRQNVRNNSASPQAKRSALKLY